MGTSWARRGGVAALAVLCACSTSPGEAGPAGRPGARGVRANAAGVESDCAPGEYFCDGTRLWRCTRTGLDAKLAQDCAAVSSYDYRYSRGVTSDELPIVFGTPTNPGVCGSESCPSGASACCLSSAAVCVWSFAGAIDASGTYRSGQSAPTACVPPGAAPECAASAPWFTATWSDRTQSCPAVTRTLGVQIDRRLAAPGVVVLQTAGAGVTLSLMHDDPALSCATWSGTIEWAEGPDWLVRIEASCADAGKGSLVVRGDLHGRI